eukprot:403366687
MSINIQEPEKTIQNDSTFKGLNSKQYEIVKAINSQDLIYLIDLGVLENNCQIDLNFTLNDEGLTPLMLSIAKQNAGLVELVLNTANMHATTTDQFGYTALHYAAIYKNLEIVKLLFESRVYHSKANNGMTPLHLACKNGALDIVHFFVSNCGLNINETKDGERGKLSPLAFAIAKGNFEIATYLINKGAMVTSHIFYLSCKHANIPFSTFLLDKLRDMGQSEDLITATVINGRYDSTQSTPLMRACQYGNVQTAKVLVEQWNALTDVANRNDENCLIVAVRYRQLQSVQYLCQSAIKPNTSLEVDYESSRNGLTALARAVMQHDFQIADVLLNVGKAFKGYVNRKDGKSILELATMQKNQEAINYINTAQGGASKQTNADSKFIPTQLYEQAPAKISQSKVIPQKQPDDQELNTSMVKVKKELQIGKGDTSPINQKGKQSAQQKLQQVVKNTNDERQAALMNPRASLQNPIGKTNNENMTTQNLETQQNQTLKAENYTTDQQKINLASPIQKTRMAGSIEHTPSMSDHTPLIDKSQKLIGATSGMKVAQSMQQELKKPSLQGSDVDLLKNYKSSNLEQVDEVSADPTRPDSRQKLVQNAANQNMKETMDKLKNLKDEYRKKYTYKNFTNNNGKKQ